MHPTHPSHQAIDLEAVCKARQHGVTVPPNGQKGWWAELRWGYKCRGRPWVLRVTALLAAAASVVVVWSEATIGSGRSPDLSPLSLMLRAVPHSREFGEQLLVALPLIYMCACAYFSLLKLGNFSFYHVVGAAGGGGGGDVQRDLGKSAPGARRWRLPADARSRGAPPLYVAAALAAAALSSLLPPTPARPSPLPGPPWHLGLLPPAQLLPDGPFRRAALLQLPARHTHERPEPGGAGAPQRGWAAGLGGGVGQRGWCKSGRGAHIASREPPSQHAAGTLSLEPPSASALCFALLQKMVFFQKMGAMNSDVPILGQVSRGSTPRHRARMGCCSLGQADELHLRAPPPHPHPPYPPHPPPTHPHARTSTPGSL